MIILILSFLFLLLFYLYFLVGISKGLEIVSRNEPKTEIENEYISVIIPYRNEEQNILNSLISISSQSIADHKYEIIFIDDNSTDNSYSILEKANKNSNVVLLKSPSKGEERAHKKLALQFAIENAKGDIIVTTDADCTHGSNWLETIIGSFDESTAFVSGPVEFNSDGSLFSEIQKLEFSSLILVGAGLIGIKSPIICNAANLGFRKSVYTKVGGYNDNLKLTSGDDEFLMQKIARETNYKIKFCFKKAAITFTNANKDFNQFYQQRKRWASKGFHYVDKMIVLKLVLIFLFYLGIPIQIILGILADNIYYVTALVSLLLKFIFEYKIVLLDSKNLFVPTKIQYFFLAQILHIPYIIISGISGLFGNYKWKDRSIKR